MSRYTKLYGSGPPPSLHQIIWFTLFEELQKVKVRVCLAVTDNISGLKALIQHERFCSPEYLNVYWQENDPQPQEIDHEKFRLSFNVIEMSDNP